MPSWTLDKYDVNTRIVPVQKAFSLFTRRLDHWPIHGFRLRGTQSRMARRSRSRRPRRRGFEDSVACTVTVDEVFSNDDGQIAPLDPLPCPITLAWSEKDSLLPVATYGEIARERLPQATFEVLPDVGHVPMFDDPELVARTILAVTGAGRPQR